MEWMAKKFSKKKRNCHIHIQSYLYYFKVNRVVQYLLTIIILVKNYHLKYNTIQEMLLIICTVPYIHTGIYRRVKIKVIMITTS